MSVAWDNVYRLLNIVHDSRGLPSLKPLHDLAMFELEKQSAMAATDLEKEQKEKATADEKKAAELRKKEEEERKKDEALEQPKAKEMAYEER